MKRILNLLITVVLFALTGSLYSQISVGGNPLSFNQETVKVLTAKVLTATMPFVDEEALRQEDLITDKIKDMPWRFGQNINVSLNLSNSGLTDYLPDGSKLWRLRIYSQGARSINLTFDNYRLPDGAKLYIYNDDKSEVLGAFTSFNNQEDRFFATTLISGDAVTLEYFEPANVPFVGELNLSRVTHGYRGIKDYLKDLGDAGSCQINAHCSQGTGWENQIRSVCMLVTGGSGFCTGALINNTANDGTPYVLTANHCSTSNDWASWVFWFNWEASGCTNPTSSPSYNSISGSNLKARNAGSNFCLVQMNTTPPSNYNVYYAGWDRSGTAATSGMAIHHPSGDIKKISPCGAMTQETYSSASCWKAPWSSAACTEPGSSGSPLFNQNKRIVGQLYGGPSSCGASQMYDYYGRFDVSWTGGGSNSTRLSNWLDPSSTGATTIDGYDPNGAAAPTVNFSANATSSCTGSITFTDQSTNSPTSWLWNFGDGTTSTVQNPTHLYVANGTYTVTLQATNTVGSNSLVKSNYITINKPAGPTGTGVTVCNPSTATLTATGNGTIKWYSSQSSTNALFTGNTYTTPVLTTTTTYYAEDNITSTPVHGGKTDSTGGGSFFTSSTVHYEVFDVFVPLVLQTVKIYANAAQTGKIITLQNSAGATLASATVNLSSGINTITLNFSLPVDTGLRLVGPASPGWYRNNTGIVYPISTAGKFSITRSSAGPPATNPYYYYFYDWVVKENDCISNRTPVTATVITCTDMAETASPSLTLSPNPVTQSLNIDFAGITGNNISVEIYDIIGCRVYSEKLNVDAPGFSKSINTDNFNKGVYFLKVTSGSFTKTYKFEKI